MFKFNADCAPVGDWVVNFYSHPLVVEVYCSWLCTLHASCIRESLLRSAFVLVCCSLLRNPFDGGHTLLNDPRGRGLQTASKLYISAAQMMGTELEHLSRIMKKNCCKGIDQSIIERFLYCLLCFRAPTSCALKESGTMRRRRDNSLPRNIRIKYFLANFSWLCICGVFQRSHFPKRHKKQGPRPSPASSGPVASGRYKTD